MYVGSEMLRIRGDEKKMNLGIKVFEKPKEGDGFGMILISDKGNLFKDDLFEGRTSLKKHKNVFPGGSWDHRGTYLCKYKARWIFF